MNAKILIADDESDIVSIKIKPEFIKMKLKGDIKKYEI